MKKIFKVVQPKSITDSIKNSSIILKPDSLVEIPSNGLSYQFKLDEVLLGIFDHIQLSKFSNQSFLMALFCKKEPEARLKQAFLEKVFSELGEDSNGLNLGDSWDDGLSSETLYEWYFDDSENLLFDDSKDICFSITVDEEPEKALGCFSFIVMNAEKAFPEVLGIIDNV
ncbi:hypothetical protein AAG747_26820 [Rapidithrix thailandica]|uniref:Uncharacterized protein n=1 Tax=Rapidithrix thailandica TaxID=413964 RepID=A0AAW9SCC5_9BACT